MISFKRTDSDNADFIALVKLLDAELAIIDGTEHAFYDQYNKIVNIKHTLVAYNDEKPVACGAIKELVPGIMEIKRMYTLPEYRGKGIAGKILSALENWATELGYTKCVLETGIRQPDAIHLYTRSGYKVIANYGQYAGVENSVCFEKTVGS